MENDLPEDTLAVRGDLRVLLATLSIFESLPDDTLDAIAQECEWISLPGGAA